MRAFLRFWFVKPCRTRNSRKLSSGDPADQDFGLEAILQRKEKDWESWQWCEKHDVGMTPRASPTASPWRSRAFAASAVAEGEEEEEPKPPTSEYDELPQDSPHASEPARSGAPVGPKSTLSK